MIKEKDSVGPFLAVQGLRVHTFKAEGMGSNPGQGTKIPHTIQHSLKKKKNQKNNNVEKEGKEVRYEVKMTTK